MSKLPKIKPLGDRVLIQVKKTDLANNKTKGGIIIPDTIDKERPEQGKIVALGEGRLGDDGKLIPLKVKKGQEVIFAKYGPDQIKIEGEEYLIVKESDILAILE